MRDKILVVMCKIMGTVVILPFYPLMYLGYVWGVFFAAICCFVSGVITWNWESAWKAFNEITGDLKEMVEVALF